MVGGSRGGACSAAKIVTRASNEHAHTHIYMYPGVIHVLDGLLQPVIPGFDPFAQAQEQNEGPPAGVTAPLGKSPAVT